MSDSISVNDIRVMKAEKKRQEEIKEQIKREQEEQRNLEGIAWRKARYEEELRCLYLDIKKEVEKENGKNLVWFKLIKYQVPGKPEYCWFDPIQEKVTEDLIKNGFKVKEFDRPEYKIYHTGDGEFTTTTEIEKIHYYLEVSWDE